MNPHDSNSPARDRLLDAAQELMLARGYVATSVNAICAAADLTKGSFFHYFENKEELGKVLLQRFAERQQAGFLEACSEVEDPLERVFCMVDCAIQGARNPDMKGCLIGTFAQEISETHPELRQICELSFGGFSSSVGRDLVAAKQLYRPDADFDAESLGEHFLSIAQGSMLLLRANGDRAVLERSLLHFRHYLETLYERSPAVRTAECED